MKTMISLLLGTAITSLAQQTPSLSHFLTGIDQKTRDQKSRASTVIVAFGDSITMGATARNTIEPEAVYHARLKKMLEARFPRATFSVINSGIGGDSAEGSLQRIERDVLRYQPDLVLVAFGANGLGMAPERLDRYKAALTEIVHRIKNGSQADIILLTTPYMASRDNGVPSASQKEQLATLIECQNTGVVKHFADGAKDVAAKEGVYAADVYAGWEQLANQGVDTTAMLANGINHPTGDAHEIGAKAVFAVIEKAASSP